MYRKKVPVGYLVAVIFITIILLISGCEKGNLGIRGGSISGIVVDSRTLTGLSGVNVVAVNGEGETKASKYTTTDSRGFYYLSDLRAGEWLLSFEKFGYTPINSESGATEAIKVVVVNNEHKNVPEVRMVRNIADQYILIKGLLKDAVTGGVINWGTVQYKFGQTVFNNRLPSDFIAGFSVPAQAGPLEVIINVTGYETYTTTIADASTDSDLGVIMLKPQTYKIIGVWKDVPGWVFRDNPTASIIAYAGNKIVATTSAQLQAQTFELTGIPMGTSVTVECTIKGYRMNSPIPIVPNSDFQGVIYQNFSLRTNFTPIMRDVRIIITGTSISNNDRVGAYCNETGTIWSPITVTGGTFGFGVPRVIDLGVNQVPTGYTLSFTGYIVEQGRTGTVQVQVNDDGPDPQIVTIQVS